MTTLMWAILAWMFGVSIGMMWAQQHRDEQLRKVCDLFWNLTMKYERLKTSHNPYRDRR